ncbi:2-oxo-tetronate isomerase [Roseomonas sp. GCM10028921]
MPRFAANLSMMFTELPFLDRFAAAGKAGFGAVEFLFPYEHPPETVAARLREAGLVQALFNMPPGDWAAGERGMAAIPGREGEFRDNVAIALRYAKALGCKTLHAMSGITTGLDRTACEASFVENFRFAADMLAPEGITLLVEPINSRNMPGYFIAHQRNAVALVERVGRANVSVQLDLYHAQIMDGDLTRLIEAMAGKFAHVQIASVPDRHEPDEGELNYLHLYQVLERVGYQGWIGCEYNPRGETTAGLSWFAPYRAR